MNGHRRTIDHGPGADDHAAVDGDRRVDLLTGFDYHVAVL